jgi:hypothetical protein
MVQKTVDRISKKFEGAKVTSFYEAVNLIKTAKVKSSELWAIDTTDLYKEYECDEWFALCAAAHKMDRITTKEYRVLIDMYPVF